MNKKIRQDLKQKKYIKRIRRFVAGLDIYISRNGERIYHPKTIDVLNDNGQLHYKNTSTPCSCRCCALGKYKRHLQKKEDVRIIAESLYL